MHKHMAKENILGDKQEDVQIYCYGYKAEF